LARTEGGTVGNRWRHNLLFVRKLFRHGTQIAALLPSGRFLCRRCIKYIDFDRVHTIVELGAGTGPVTEQIVQRMRPHSRFLVVELDPDFCQVLRDRFRQPNVEILQTGFEDLPALLEARGIDRVDYMISGLPTPTLSHEQLDRLLEIIRKHLAPDGAFHQLTHAPLVWKKFYRNIFASVRFEFEAMNAPPGGVYFCRNAKSQPGLPTASA